MPTRLIAGCMTGTSIDAVDCALVEITGAGLAMNAQLLGFTSRPLGDLAPATRMLADQRPMTAGQIAALERDLALLHVEALRELLGTRAVDLIALHGQTVYHKPPVTWQLANPAVIAQALNTPVLSDLRSADVAAGGQGAPITPLADWILLRSPQEERVVCNLGGFCNLTFLPRDDGAADPTSTLAHIRGMDVCPCNHLLDRLAHALFQTPFDEDGRRAMTGTVHAAATSDLVARLLALVGDGRERRSLGTGDELHAWLSAWKSQVRPEDLAASACSAIATMIAREQQGERDAAPARPQLLLAGGGARNQALVRAIHAAWPGEVSTTDDAGLPAQAREAAAMAVLGALCQDRIPITLPQVTGVASAPLAGAWVYP